MPVWRPRRCHFGVARGCNIYPLLLLFNNISTDCSQASLDHEQFNKKYYSICLLPHDLTPNDAPAGTNILIHLIRIQIYFMVTINC